MNNSKTKVSLTPAIYVADLAAYNAGHLHGEWIDATLDVEDIELEIQEILKHSPVGDDAEEYAIHDTSDFWEAEISEYEDLTTVVEIARFLQEHGRLGAKLISYLDNDLEIAKEAIDNHYCGEYESVEDYVQEFIGDTTQIPENLIYYIDYEKIARDMDLNGDIFTIELGCNEVHIFYNF
ncbi:MAG: antirestriction protein ArdA [Symploca sp. SIO3C6]|nr:antirestriction protein ArdA [Symploca sp. SIO3C6]